MNPRLASLALLVLLSACFGLEHVETLRTSKNSAPTQFEQELASLYLQFVDEELEKYDWVSAGYFAEKGLLAAKGEFAAPEDPDSWSIPAYAIEELRSARVAVEAKLTPAFRASQPRAAAMLLFSYDCWVEEQEEAWEASAIEKCKRGVMYPMEETDKPVEAQGGPLSTSYLFHFPENETELEGLARDELAVIARTLSDYRGPYQVMINGNAERNKDETVALSLRRADYLRDYLSARGVRESQISYNAFGDTMQEPAGGSANRVELFIE